MKNLQTYLATTSPSTIYQCIIIIAVITKNPYFLLFILFALISQIVNNTVKYLVKQKRPDPCGQKIDGQCTGCGIYPDKGKVSNTMGFPSGHAQFLAFTAMFWAIYIFRSFSSEKWIKIVQISILWVIALLVSYQRVYSGCHSVLQVSVGTIIGAFLGWGAYLLCNKIIPSTFI